MPTVKEIQTHKTDQWVITKAFIVVFPLFLKGVDLKFFSRVHQMYNVKQNTSS